MKKLNSFILHFIVIGIFVLLISVFYHMKVEKVSSLWLFYDSLLDFLFFLPVNAALSMLWPQIFRSKAEQEAGGRSSSGFTVIFFIFIMVGAAILLQELAVPKLYDFINYQEQLSQMHIRKLPKFEDKSGDRFSLSEFNNIKYMPNKNNIAYSMGRSYVYFQKMYDGNGAYYVEGFRLIAFTDKKQLEYIMTADYAKVVGTEIMVVSPMFFQYSGGALSSSKRISGVKRIPMVYEASGVYNLSAESTAGVASLIDVFLNNDYVYSSRINFFHLGNIVFNKIAYYIALVFMLILAGSFGASYRNQRLLYREYVQTACFYTFSFLFITLLYDTIISVVNMIYGMII